MEFTVQPMQCMDTSADTLNQHTMELMNVNLTFGLIYHEEELSAEVPLHSCHIGMERDRAVAHYAEDRASSSNKRHGGSTTFGTWELVLWRGFGGRGW